MRFSLKQLKQYCTVNNLCFKFLATGEAKCTDPRTGEVVNILWIDPVPPRNEFVQTPDYIVYSLGQGVAYEIIRKADKAKCEPENFMQAFDALTTRRGLNANDALRVMFVAGQVEYEL